MTENLDCPFCGGKVIPEGHYCIDIPSPECEDCGATASCLAIWNRRVGGAPAPSKPMDLTSVEWEVHEEVMNKREADKEKGFDFKQVPIMDFHWDTEKPIVIPKPQPETEKIDVPIKPKYPRVDEDGEI